MRSSSENQTFGRYILTKTLKFQMKFQGVEIWSLNDIIGITV